MTTSKRLILFGCGDLAQIAKLYFERDTDYEVVAFTMDNPTEKEFMGIPLIPWSEIHNHFLPEDHYMHACVVYGDMNRNRTNICARIKRMGYRLASYISPHAYCDPEAEIGEHAFIFENNVIQPFVKIGDNCVLWSGNHIGHSSIIGNNCFISSHVCVSGWCTIGDNSFIGVNSTIPNNIKIGKECWISHGSVINEDIPDHSMVKSACQINVYPLDEERLARAIERSRR